MKKQKIYRWLFLFFSLLFLGLGLVRNWPVIYLNLQEIRIPFLSELLSPGQKEQSLTSEQDRETKSPGVNTETKGASDETARYETDIQKEPPLTDETDTFRSLNYYYLQLNDEEKKIYLELLQGLQHRETAIGLMTSDDDAIDRIYHGLLKDHPEIFWVHNRGEVYKTTYNYREDCIFRPFYLYNEEETREIRESMEQAFQEVSRRIPEDADEYGIVNAVYVYLIDETEYLESEHDQSIAGVFWKKQAVCAGYAGAVQYLLGRLGISCIYVDGEVPGRTEGHAWDMVQINGNWYYVDATNGDQPEFLSGDFVSLEEHKTIIMDYLCPFPQEYESDYQPSEDFSLPACTATDQNFYVRNKGIFYDYDWQTVYDYCCMRIDNNAAVVRFKFASQDAYLMAVMDWIDGEDLQKVAQYYMQRNGLQSIEYHFGVLEDLKTIYFIF